MKHFPNLPLLLQIRTETGNSVLHSAIKRDRPVPVICKLLKLGVDPLAKNRHGQTPADLARSKGQTLIAQLLDRAAQDKQNKKA